MTQTRPALAFAAAALALAATAGLGGAAAVWPNEPLEACTPGIAHREPAHHIVVDLGGAHAEANGADLGGIDETRFAPVTPPLEAAIEPSCKEVPP